MALQWCSRTSLLTFMYSSDAESNPLYKYPTAFPQVALPFNSMPKAAKGRSTARPDPLSAKDRNASKKTSTRKGQTKSETSSANSGAPKSEEQIRSENSSATTGALK